MRSIRGRVQSDRGLYRRSRGLQRLLNAADPAFAADLRRPTRRENPFSLDSELLCTSKALDRIELSTFGLHWPELDEDLSIRGILAGDFGQRSHEAA